MNCSPAPVNPLVGVLRLADDLALPLDAVTQTLAILGTRGSGKTQTGSVLAEELIEAGQRVAVIDPTGVWWGLKASLDGREAGHPVVVFGGEHADVPLAPDMGTALGELVAGEPFPCILDVSDLVPGEQFGLVAAVADALYRRNREPLHLIVDEADEYAPQVPGRDQAHVLRAMDRLVRRGRVKGLGVTLITQRPAALHKNVLTQIQALIAHQLTAKQDRDAIESWISAQADTEQKKDVLATLAELGVGEAWIWSPRWLRLLSRVQMRRRRTFDSSATPAVGERVREPVALARVDLAALQERLTSALERSRSDEPAVLHARIEALERQLGSRPEHVERPERAGRGAEPVIQRVVERVSVPVLREGEGADLAAAAARMGEMGRRLLDAADGIRLALEALARGTLAPRPAPGEAPTAAPRASEPVQGAGNGRLPERPASHLTRPATRPLATCVASATPAPATESGLSAPQRRILDALASFEHLGLREVARGNVAVWADQSPRSSGYANNLGALRSLGLVDYPRPGWLTLTDAGRQVAQVPEAIWSVGQLHAAWYAKLQAPQARILRALIAAYPDALPREDLAARARQSPSSSGYANNLGALRSLGLVDYPRAGQVVATALLFPAPGTP